MTRAKKGDLTKFILAAVESDTDDCITWPYAKNTAGYGMVDYEGCRWFAHRLVCHLIHGPPADPRMHAAHGPCRNRLCVNHRHVYWATAKENSADQKRDGTAVVGERQHLARLRADDVRRIRAVYTPRGPMNLYVLAGMYGVSVTTVNRVVLRQTWQHIR